MGFPGGLKGFLANKVKGEAAAEGESAAMEGKEIDFDLIVKQGKREEKERKNLSIDRK
jgi:hypothetical protein